MASATAWYVLPSGRLLPRWFNILHWPYTLWHLSYAVMGAALAVNMNWSLLGWTVLAFFLGMGISAHCYDLLKGDPLKLGLSDRALQTVAFIAILGAMAIGFWQTWWGPVSLWLYIAIPLGALFAAGYGLEWPGLHGNWRFATWWAVFPLLVGYFAQGLEWTLALAPLVVFAFLTAMAQRVLSTRARWLRREIGEVYLAQGWGLPVDLDEEGTGDDTAWLLRPLDGALKWMSFALPVVALTMLARHISI